MLRWTRNLTVTVLVRSCCCFGACSLQLGIFNGDAVLLKGKKRKDTVCIALVEEGLEDAPIRMSKVSYVLSRHFSWLIEFDGFI